MKHVTVSLLLSCCLGSAYGEAGQHTGVGGIPVTPVPIYPQNAPPPVYFSLPGTTGVMAHLPSSRDLKEKARQLPREGKK